MFVSDNQRNGFSKFQKKKMWSSQHQKHVISTTEKKCRHKGIERPAQDIAKIELDIQMLNNNRISE